MAKRLCTEESNWPNLPIELLELIVKEIDSDRDIPCFKAVCPSWNMAAKSYLSFVIPQLLISSTDNQQQDHKSDTSLSRFFSLRENKVYTLKKVFGRFSAETHCVGSSRGFLVILDPSKKIPNLYLVDPFSQVQIRLPSLKTLITTTSIDKKDIKKVILSSDPYACRDSFMAVVMHSYSGGLAFCKHGDKNWTHFGNRDYCDIIYHRSKLYALSFKLGAVEVWDFQDNINININININNLPTKVSTIECVTALEEWKTYGLDLYGLNTQCYKVRCHLVESLGEILLVLRLIGKFDNMARPGFITRRFAVCKLDFSGQRWVPIRSSSDRTKLIDEYEHCVQSERYSSYNSDDYLTQSLVLLDQHYW